MAADSDPDLTPDELSLRDVPSANRGMSATAGPSTPGPAADDSFRAGCSVCLASVQGEAARLLSVRSRWQIIQDDVWDILSERA
jgi:hypothetical protein